MSGVHCTKNYSAQYTHTRSLKLCIGKERKKPKTFFLFFSSVCHLWVHFSISSLTLELRPFFLHSLQQSSSRALGKLQSEARTEKCHFFFFFLLVSPFFAARWNVRMGQFVKFPFPAGKKNTSSLEAISFISLMRQIKIRVRQILDEKRKSFPAATKIYRPGNNISLL